MCINDFTKSSQSITKIRKDEKGDLVKESHSILAKWRNHFSQLFNVHGVNDVRQKEIHTIEPQVPDLSAFDIETAFENLQRHKSLDFDQILGDLLQLGVE